MHFASLGIRTALVRRILFLISDIFHAVAACVHLMLKLKLDKHRIEYMYAHTASSQFAAIIYAEKVKQRGAPLRTRWKFMSTCCGDARNNARCTQARKTTHGLDGQHQDVDGTLRGMTKDTDKWRKYVHGVASPRIEPRGRLKNRTEQNNCGTAPTWTLPTPCTTKAHYVSVIHKTGST